VEEAPGEEGYCLQEEAGEVSKNSLRTVETYDVPFQRFSGRRDVTGWAGETEIQACDEEEKRGARESSPRRGKSAKGKKIL